MFILDIEFLDCCDSSNGPIDYALISIKGYFPHQPEQLLD